MEAIDYNKIASMIIVRNEFIICIEKEYIDTMEGVETLMKLNAQIKEMLENIKL